MSEKDTFGTFVPRKPKVENTKSHVRIDGESSRPGARHLEITGNCSGEVFAAVVERFYQQYAPTLIAVDNVARWSYGWKVIMQVNERTFSEFCERTSEWFLFQSDVGAYKPDGPVAEIQIEVPSSIGIRGI